MAFESAFERMHARLFARMGQPASVQGVECLAIIAHGVATLGEYGEVAAHVSTASLRSALNARAGNALSVGNDRYVLDALIHDDGYCAEFTLRKAP